MQDGNGNNALTRDRGLYFGFYKKHRYKDKADKVASNETTVDVTRLTARRSGGNKTVMPVHFAMTRLVAIVPHKQCIFFGPVLELAYNYNLLICFNTKV